MQKMNCEAQNQKENQTQTFSGEIVELYDNKKFSNGKRGFKLTGHALLNNKSPYGVIDIDINAEDEEDRKIQMKDIYGALPKDNLKIVKTGSYGLHYYTKYDSLDDHPDREYVNNNRYSGIYESEAFNVDLFIPHNLDAQSLIVLPGSKCKNKHGTYGTYELLNDCDDDNLMTTSAFLKILDEDFDVQIR